MSINHPHYEKSFPKYIVSALSSHMHTLPTPPSFSHQAMHEFLRMRAAGVLDLNCPHWSNLCTKALSQTSVPVTYPLYIEMNDLSVHPIKKCQSLYSTKDEVKTAFVFLLINIYDRSAVRQGRVSCVSWLPWYLPVTSGRWQATDKGQRWGTRLE